MVADISRLVLGLAITVFHRPIAEYILQQERLLVGLLHTRGLHAPQPPSEAVAHNIYFALGIMICLISLGKLYLAIQ